METALILLIVVAVASFFAWCVWKTRSPESVDKLRNRWSQPPQPRIDDN